MTASLVLLHGFLGAPEAWDAVAGAASRARDVAITAPALPGHGRGATMPPATWDATVDAVAAGLPPGASIVAGYSNGGRLALGLLARHPRRVAALVLVSTHLGLTEATARAERSADDARLAALAEGEGMEALIAAHAARPALASQATLPLAVREALAARRRDHEARAVAGSLRAAGLGAMPDLRPALARAAVPVVAVAGERDVTYAAIAREAARLATGEVVLAAGAGHDVVLEAPGVVVDAVLRAVDRAPAHARSREDVCPR